MNIETIIAIVAGVAAFALVAGVTFATTGITADTEDEMAVQPDTVPEPSVTIEPAPVEQVSDVPVVGTEVTPSVEPEQEVLEIVHVWGTDESPVVELKPVETVKADTPKKTRSRTSGKGKASAGKKAKTKEKVTPKQSNKKAVAAAEKKAAAKKTTAKKATTKKTTARKSKPETKTARTARNTAAAAKKLADIKPAKRSKKS